jgi:signal transduction histidine kinase
VTTHAGAVRYAALMPAVVARAIRPLPFDRKLVIAFAVAIGVPLIAYAGLAQWLGEARVAQMDEAALEQRLCLAENHLQETGGRLLVAARGGGRQWPAIAQPRGPVSGEARAAFATFCDAVGVDAACVVRPAGQGAALALGRHLALDGQISAAPVVSAAAAGRPGWGLLADDGAVVVVAAAPLAGAPASPGQRPVLALGRRLDSAALARILGGPDYHVTVQRQAPDGAVAGAQACSLTAGCGEGFCRVPAASRDDHGTLSATDLLADPAGAGPAAVLTASANLSALPGRGPRFATVAACAFGCALLLAALLTSMVSAWVSRPVDDLRRGMEALARGERLSEPLEVVSDDSLGHMTAAFNDLLANLDDARRTMLHSERLAMAGRMASTVAHEVRNVLTPLQLRVDMLLQIASDRAVRDSLTGMKQEITRGAGLLRNLLDLARNDPSGRQPVAVDDLLRRVIELVEPYSRRLGVVLHLGDVTGGAQVAGDRSQLLQALVNIVNNACEAGARNVTLSASVRGDDALLRVKDDGPGMDAETARRALEPFYTTKPEGQGTGLGLSVCQTAVAVHGGTLSLESTLGLGTRVAMALPLSGGDTCSPSSWS